jgi:hypothetical protein
MASEVTTLQEQARNHVRTAKRKFIEGSSAVVAMMALTDPKGAAIAQARIDKTIAELEALERESVALEAEGKKRR